MNERRIRKVLAFGMVLALVVGVFVEAQAQGSRVLYGVNSIDDGLSRIDPETGIVTFIGPLHPDPCRFVTPVAMAVSSDGTIFVWNNSDEDETTGGSIHTGVLLTVDPTWGIATEVKPSTPPQGQMGALAFAPDGRLFGTGTYDGYGLFEIDLETGERSLIGYHVPEDPWALRVAGADFSVTGTLYGITFSNELVTIDTITGEASLIAELSVDIGTPGSIAFTPEGTLIGSGFGPSLNSTLFDIDINDGTVSNIRSVVPYTGMPQGMGFLAVRESMDISPQECPNTISLVSMGEVIHIAILGTASFDASKIDLETVILTREGYEGRVTPIGSKLWDVATPFEGYLCGCNNLIGDGYLDQELEFDMQEVAETLNLEDAAGETVPLILTANLIGEENIVIKGLDCVLVLTGESEINEILEFFDESVETGNLEGVGQGWSADHRLNTLRNMIEEAKDFIEAGLVADACEQLMAVYRKTDGNPTPPDFVTGEAALELASLILVLMEMLGCE